MGKIGKTKSRKTDQPKRKRYHTEKRGLKNKVKKLEQHIEGHANDHKAQLDLPRLRELFVRGNTKRGRKKVPRVIKRVNLKFT